MVRAKRTSTNSAIVWRGESEFLIGAPIMAIVTGLTRPSMNPKTGPMAQLWIVRSDMSPLEAIGRKADYAVCGDCPLRGDGTHRACYVSMKNAPLAIYRAADSYPIMTPAEVNAIIRERGLSLRLGAYGEPTAIPLNVIQELAEGVRTTGYTHQWMTKSSYRPYLMASVDTPEQAERAHMSGWRTFRTRTTDEPLRDREIICPASDEGGKRTTCEKCTLCNGTTKDDRRKSIAIIAHGNGKVHFLTFRR